MTVYLGQAFINKPAPGVPPHLWMVLSDPIKSERVVLANLSSTPCPSGETCIIRLGEHPSVSHHSFVRFGEVRVSTHDLIDKGLAAGVLQQTSDLALSILERVQHAVARSKVVPIEALTILKTQGYAPEPEGTPKD